MKLLHLSLIATADLCTFALQLLYLAIGFVDFGGNLGSGSRNSCQSLVDGFEAFELGFCIRDIELRDFNALAVAKYHNNSGLTGDSR